MICPVCGKETKMIYRDCIDFIEMERGEECGIHYNYEFVTGYFREFFFGVIVSGTDGTLYRYLVIQWAKFLDAFINIFIRCTYWVMKKRYDK